MKKLFILGLFIFLFTSCNKPIQAKAKIGIEGMTCKEGCAFNIQESLNETEGITRAIVDFEHKEAVIEYDKNKISPVELVNTIQEVGDYKATIKK